MARSRSRRGSPLYTTPSFELFGKSRDLIIKRLDIFGPLYILPAIFLIGSWLTNTSTLKGSSRWTYDFQNHGSGLAFPTFPAYSWGFFVALGVGALIWLAVSLVIQVMTQSAQLRVAEDSKLNFSLLWRTVKELGLRMLGLYIAIALIFIVIGALIGIGILLGTAGLVVGAILAIILWFMALRRVFLAPYVLLDEKRDVISALKRSNELSDRNPGSIWGILGVMFLISLVSAVPYIGSLISFILAFLYSAAPALRYIELKKISA